MPFTVPSWFKQRQGKAEPAGDNVYRLTGPNLGEAFIGIRKGPNNLWAGYQAASATGPDLEATEPRYEIDADAWNAIFELYRRRVIV